MSDRTAIRMGGQRSSGPLTTVAVPAPRDRAGRRRAPAGGGHHDQRMAGQPRQLDRAELEPARRRARRAPAGPRRAPRPGRRASRRRGPRPGGAAGPPARRGRARAATARAVTHGQAPRWAGSWARTSARTAATAMGAMVRQARRRVSRRRPRPRSRGSGPSCRSIRRAAPAAPAGRSRGAGRAGRRPSRGPRTRRCPVAKERHGRQAVEDVRDGDLARVADGGQVDRRGPGEEQPDVAVDGGPLRGVRTRPSPSSPASRASSYAAGSGGRPSTRVGSGSRAGCRARLLYHVPIVPRRATPGVIVSHHERDPVLRPSVRFMAGSPRTPRGPPYPGCPSADDGRYAAARGESTRLSTNCPEAPGIRG